MSELTSDDIAAVAPAPAGAESSPAPSTAAESAPAPATEASAVSGEAPPDSAGPIPFDRHKAILEHAREEAARHAQDAARKQYGWVDGYQREQVEQAARLLAWYQQDPKSLVAYLQQQLPKEPDGPPQPDLRAEDGTPVYSAPQLQKLLEFQRAQLAQEYGPVKQQVQAAQMRESAFLQAQRTLAAAREKWPLFTDLEEDIKGAMREDASLDLRDAYIQVYAEKGRQAEREKWKAEYEGTVTTKTAATTSRPGRAASVQPRKYTEMDTRDVVEEVARSIGWRG